MRFFIFYCFFRLLVHSIRHFLSKQSLNRSLKSAILDGVSKNFLKGIRTVRFKVIIIHPDSRISNIIAERLTAYGCIVQAIGTTAEEAYVLCRSCSADAIIMAAELSDATCDTVTARLEQEVSAPLVKIAISESDNRPLSNRFYDYCGDLFLFGPVDYAFCVDKIKSLLRLRQRQGVPLNHSPLVRGCTRKHLLRMKMPTNVCGFVYLLDAVELVIRESALQDNLVYGLYTKVGRLHDEPYGNIERCIRTAVEKAFECGDINYIHHHFGPKIRDLTGKPKNGDFIEILAKMVRDDLKRWH